MRGTQGQPVDYNKLNDEALLRLIAQAQENALGELYDRYSRLVYSMALNSVNEPALAEEITQDVSLRIWKNKPLLPGGPGHDLDRAPPVTAPSICCGA